MGSQLFTQTVTRAAAVAVKTVNLGRGTPHFLRPVLAGARTVTTLAWRVTCVGLAARYPLFAGLGLILLGALASTSTVNLLSAAGLAAVLAGLLLVAVGAARRIVLALAIVTVAAGAALAAAAYIPFLRSHLFPWLEKTVLPSLAKHPAQWAILVLFVLLPPLWTIVSIIQRLARRGRPAAPSQRPRPPRRRSPARPRRAVTGPIWWCRPRRRSAELALGRAGLRPRRARGSPSPGSTSRRLPAASAARHRPVAAAGRAPRRDRPRRRTPAR